MFGKIIPSTQCARTQECEVGINHLISDWAEAKALASSQAHTWKLVYGFGAADNLLYAHLQVLELHEWKLL